VQISTTPDLINLRMSSDMDPLQRAFYHFIQTLPRTSLDQLVQYIHSVNDGVNPSTNENFVQRSNEIVDSASSPSRSENARANSSGFEARIARYRRSRDKMRPLNSFMAFRSKRSHFSQKTQSN
jgi:hypothetical protein